MKGLPCLRYIHLVTPSAAKLFTSEFYKTIVLGFPVDRAIQSTRNAISQDVGLDKRDFATPVLYMRARDGIILNGL